MNTRQYSYFTNIMLVSSNDSYDVKIGKLYESLDRMPSDWFYIVSRISNSIQAPLYITSDPVPGKPNATGSYVVAYHEAATDDMYPGVTFGHLLYMSPMEYEGVSVHGFQGGDFTVTFDRLFFHELFHVFVNSPIMDSAGFVDVLPWYSDQHIDFNEELAVFAENFIYAHSSLGIANGDTGVRLGHLVDNYDGPIINSGGVSGMAGFDGANAIRTVTNTENTVTFKTEEVRKTYYSPTYDMFNDKSVRTTYDHYIRYESNSGADFRDPSNIIKGSGFASIIPNIMFDAPDSGMQKVADAFRSVDELLTQYASGLGLGYDSIRSYAVRSGIGLALNASPRYADEMPNRAVGIGADRWVDSYHNDAEPADPKNNDWVYDISGPVQHGSAFMHRSDGTLDPGAGPTISAARLGINDLASTESAILVGGSGFKILGSAINPFDDYINASGSSDWIIAGKGNDVLIMGSGGLDAANQNYGYGNDGRDMLVGRNGMDNLFGGTNDDIFSPGGGVDYIVGGSGIDTLTYIDSTVGVSLNMTIQTGTGGDAEGDQWRGIERFIGSDHNDTFIGNGGAFLSGGIGNDIFYLKDGDIGFGGAGADTFHIETDPSTGHISIGIIDLDQNDRIVINGQIFGGYSASINGQINSVTTTGAIVYMENSWNLLTENMVQVTLAPMSSPWGPPTNAQPTLDIYIAGYTAGDGGLNLSPNGNWASFPFNPHDLI